MGTLPISPGETLEPPGWMTAGEVFQGFQEVELAQARGRSPHSSTSHLAGLTAAPGVWESAAGKLGVVGKGKKTQEN